MTDIIAEAENLLEEAVHKVEELVHGVVDDSAMPETPDNPAVIVAPYVAGQPPHGTRFDVKSETYPHAQPVHKTFGD
jgi:hypothetical protein